MEKVKNNVTAPKGFYASGIHCGIRKNTEKSDLALIFSEKECTASAVYTQNLVFGAPIAVTREHLSDGACRAVICNSGNANTCNAGGYEAAKIMCREAAKELGIKESDMVVASTGVIGQPLNTDVIVKGIPTLVKNLSSEGGTMAAKAIMTTDTAVKEAAVIADISGVPVTIGAICKGSGMINPNMATLLCFITTDADISLEMLDKALRTAVDASFNRISIDGDTSTNDMALIMANGLAGNKKITQTGSEYDLFVSALSQVCRELARRMARDGEGATKLITCNVCGVKSESDAVKLAKSVIMSSLVKAAMFGNDANWGRILCALGYSGVSFDPMKTNVSLTGENGKDLPVFVMGGGVDFDENEALEILGGEEVIINVTMQEGNSFGCAWGCDLSYDYVKINGSYRT